MHPKLKLVADEKKRFVRISDTLVLNTRTGFYYVRKSFKRLRIPELFETTKERTLGKARTVAEDLIEAHKAKYLGRNTDSLAARIGKPLSEVIDEILKTVTPYRRRGTQENHRMYLAEIKKEWGRWDIARITLPAWQSWLEEFRARKRRTTFGDYQKHMNLLLRYAYQHRYVNHLLVLPNPDRAKKTAFRVFTDAEIKRLWKVMNEDTRDQFVLCFECFMREREALYLTWDRIDLETGVITLRPEDVKTGSRTGKGRSFRVSKRALARLRARRKRIQGPLVFPSPTDPGKPVHQIKTAWRTAKANAKITGKARWHDLRHSAVSKALLDSKVEPLLVSEYAGVSLRTIQRVYLHSTHEQTAGVAGAVVIKA